MDQRISLRTKLDEIEGMTFVTMYTDHYLQQEIKGFDMHMSSFTHEGHVFR